MCRIILITYMTSADGKLYMYMYMYIYVYMLPIIISAYCTIVFSPYRKLCSVAVKDSSELVLLWQRESWWLYSGVLSSALDRERYWEAVSHALSKYFNEDSMVCSIHLADC